MSEARVPLAYRDSCAHLLIPLNRCRYDTYYLPWKCQVGRPPVAKLWGSGREGRGRGRAGRAHLRELTAVQDERHSYEKCQYLAFKKRVAKMDELRAAKGGARSN